MDSYTLPPITRKPTIAEIAASVAWERKVSEAAHAINARIENGESASTPLSAPDAVATADLRAFWAEVDRRLVPTDFKIVHDAHPARDNWRTCFLVPRVP